MSRALAELVLPGYSLGEIAESRYYSGGFNDTYRLKTAQGITYYIVKSILENARTGEGVGRYVHRYPQGN